MDALIILFYLSVALFAVYILNKQVEFYNQIVFDKYKFKYFAIRDRLATQVLDGQLDENSWEYKEIIETINYHIQTVETLSIHKIVRMLSDYHTSPEEMRRVRKISKKIDNPEVIKVLIDFMHTTGKLLKRNSRTEFFIYKLINKIDNAESSHIKIKMPTRALSEIENQKGVFETKLHAAAAA